MPAIQSSPLLPFHYIQGFHQYDWFYLLHHCHDFHKPVNIPSLFPCHQFHEFHWFCQYHHFHSINSIPFASSDPSITLFVLFQTTKSISPIKLFNSINSIYYNKSLDTANAVYFKNSFRSKSIIISMSSVNAINYFVSEIPLHQWKNTYPMIFIGSNNFISKSAPWISLPPSVVLVPSTS